MEPYALLLLAAALAVVAAVVLFLVRRGRRARAAALPAAVDGAGRGASPGADGGVERLRRGLFTSGRRLREQLDAVLGRGPRALDSIVADLEETLVAADVGMKTTGVLLARVRDRLGGSTDPAAVRAALTAEIADLLGAPPAPAPAGRPWVVLVTGVNGVGKTTTIGKLAAQHRARGRSVLLVAADTFRAAAIDQLSVWADRIGVDLVRHGPGADPAAVVFDGMRAALARGVDVVLVDTAGRLHTRSPLMDELRKLRRVVEREVRGAPHETLLVLDATTGQNAISQARTFTEAVQVTGVVLTKLDGTARGGVVLAVRQELGLPIRYLGIGEGIDDLRSFEATEFVQALLVAGPAGPGDRARDPGVDAVP